MITTKLPANTAPDYFAARAAHASELAALVPHGIPADQRRTVRKLALHLAMATDPIRDRATRRAAVSSGENLVARKTQHTMAMRLYRELGELALGVTG